jgi:hypothetical protein
MRIGLESSERIMAKMPAFKLSVFTLSLRPTPAEEIITRSTARRRVVAIAIPAPPSSFSTPSSLHADEVHFILLIGEVVEA